MLTVPAFYAQHRWRDEWNVLRSNGTRHRGHDIACATHEAIPLLRSGTVVATERTGILGNYAVVQVGTGVFDYYCHLLVGTRPNVGARLAQGARIGKAAGPRDDPGSAWDGVHLHYGAGPSVTSVYFGATFNATQIIRDALAGFASTGPRPFPTLPTLPAPPPPPPPPVPSNGDDLMDTSYYECQVPVGNPPKWGIFGPDAGAPGWKETGDVVTAQAWGKLYGTRYLDPDSDGRSLSANRVGAPWGLVDAATWAKMQTQAEASWNARLQLAGGPVTVEGTFTLDSATIAQLATANAVALVEEQKKPGN